MVSLNNERNSTFENNVKLLLDLYTEFISEKSQTSTDGLSNMFISFHSEHEGFLFSFIDLVGP